MTHCGKRGVNRNSEHAASLAETQIAYDFPFCCIGTIRATKWQSREPYTRMTALEALLWSEGAAEERILCAGRFRARGAEAIDASDFGDGGAATAAQGRGGTPGKGC